MDRALDDLVDTRGGGGNRRGGGFRTRGGRGGAGQKQPRGGFGNYQHDDRSGGAFGHDDRAGGGAFRRTRVSRNNAPYSRSANNTGSIETSWRHDLYQDEDEIDEGFDEGFDNGPRAGIETGTRLQITNLAYDVLAEDLKDLFESIGDVKRANVNFDKSGRSLGTATVVFSRRGDAVAALKKYNNVPLDDQPMKISLVGTNVNVGGRQNNNGNGNSFRAVQDEALTISVGAPRARRVVATGLGARRITAGRTVRIGGSRGGAGGRGRGGRGRGRGGFGSSRGKKESLTAEELDAEMDAYNQEA